MFKFDDACKKITAPQGFAMNFWQESIPAAVTEGVFALESAAFPDAWSTGAVASHVSSGGVAITLESDGAVAAYLLASLAPAAGEGELYRVCVAEKFRRRGLCRTLLEALEALSAYSGVRDIYLEVRESNLSARESYRRAGYVVIGERKNYYRNPDENAVVMAFKVKR